LYKQVERERVDSFKENQVESIWSGVNFFLKIFKSRRRRKKPPTNKILTHKLKNKYMSVCVFFYCLRFWWKLKNDGFGAGKEKLFFLILKINFLLL